MNSKLRPHARFLRDRREPVIASPNERQILDLVRRHGGVTRAELGRLTGLTAQSVMRLVDELSGRGLVSFDAAVANGRGKPSPMVRLVADYTYCVGVSIATDTVTVVLVDFAGQALTQRIEPMSPITRLGLFAFLHKMIDQVLATRPGARERLFGIGVGMTGFFVGKGSPLNPPEPLNDLALVELDTLLEQELGQPVWIDNDGNVAAIGESLLGVGREHRDFAYLYFSHGFGGGVIAGDELMRGMHGNAGEFAGMLPRLGLPRPTLELLREMHCADGADCPTIHAMLAQFDPNWRCVDRWIDAVAPSLSVVSSAIVAILDPAAIVFGGRLPPALAERLIPRIEIDNLPRRGHARPQAQLLAATAPGDAAAMGAAALPLKQHFFR
jgi:predicted NBD/HSP70 family sugar kinase